MFEIILPISLAWFFVEHNHYLKFKPFNCMKCMSGWIGFLVAYLSGENILYGFICIFVAHLIEGFKMRYL
jgi:hypothetical protein